MVTQRPLNSDPEEPSCLENPGGCLWGLQDHHQTLLEADLKHDPQPFPWPATKTCVTL